MLRSKHRQTARAVLLGVSSQRAAYCMIALQVSFRMRIGPSASRARLGIMHMLRGYPTVPVAIPEP